MGVGLHFDRTDPWTSTVAEQSNQDTHKWEILDEERSVCCKRPVFFENIGEAAQCGGQLRDISEEIGRFVLI